LVRAEKISQRFPHFYRSWDATSQVALLISAIGKCMDESEKDLVSIIYAHWVDKANGKDLDKLGALICTERKEGESDADYRNRLKIAVLRYKGGGTVESVKAAVRIALKLPQDYPIVINENSGVKRIGIYNVKTGGSWKVDQQETMSVTDAPLDIIITVRNKGSRIRDPRITNLDSKDSVTFKGELAYGDRLRITSRGKALLNGKDKTSSLKIPGTRRPLRENPKLIKEISRFPDILNLKILTLPRNGSNWMFTFQEIARYESGIFDESCFDECYFLQAEDKGIFDESCFDECYFLQAEDKGIFNEGCFDKCHFLQGEDKGIFDESCFDESCFLQETRAAARKVDFENGVFDKSAFNRSHFFLEAEASVTFEWIASQPHEFELRIARKLLTDASISEGEIKEVLNTVKASGIKADLTLLSGDV
jgi:hypothetical protein